MDEILAEENVPLKEEDPRSLFELIKSSVQIFDGVKQRLGGSYGEFRGKAKHILFCIVHTESTREGLITCEVSILLRRSVHVGPMIKSEVAQWFIILRRRMSPSAKTNNP